MSDVQLMLAHDGGARVAQQLVVMQQRTSNRILDGQHSDACRVFLHLCKHLFKGTAAYQLYLLTLKVEVGGNVVERPYQTLYRYSLHISILNFQFSI